jgi:glycyl-tRNA synthetase beta chain
MPQLLLEFFSEEIPARMQKRAEEDLARALGEKLKGAGLEAKAIKTFSSPRRIGAVIDDLPAKAADVNEEKKGPRVGAPDQAIQGFLKSAGLKDISEAQIVEDKKGAFYVARIERAGRETSAIVQEIVPEIVRGFPWPKSMRSGSGDLHWVRPLQNIMCLFDGTHVKVSVDGVPSDAKTWGHRFHAPGAIAPKDFADYVAKLRAAKVEIDREARKAKILEDAKKSCAALELVEDVGLLEEVAGLVEWPVVLLGDMDPAFLDLPGEVIRLSMRTHQKYFAVRDPKTQKLAPHFVVVANIEAKDGGKAIAAGNARVLSARLNDARFFWEMDTKRSLDKLLPKLDQIVFHSALGTVGDRARRLPSLANDMDRYFALDVNRARRAATLCKADLVSEVVAEFPELQGQIGKQLAEIGGEPHDVALAIHEHYRPIGPADGVPSNPVSCAVALADKIDALTGFFAIGEKPTGSGDPYSLRRAALGVIRIVTENKLRLRVREVIPGALQLYRNQRGQSFGVDPTIDLLAFLADRLKVQLRDHGKRHDLVDAVFALGDDDLVRIVARVEALDAFLKSQDGANLLAGYKRAANILAAEEKKAKWSAEEAKGDIDASKLAESAEKALADALDQALPAARAAVEKEEFSQAMKALSALRAPVDSFFDKVLVNAEDAALRRNRLLLLSRFSEALSAVADFSKIEG